MKVDTSLIQGYDTMTSEQKIEALLGLDMDPTKAGFRSQADFDKIMTENAEKKKRIKELETKGAADKDELTKRLEELEESNKNLLRASNIASTTAQFIGMGYDEALAKEAAEASADGDMAKLFAAQQKFLKAHDEAIKKEALKGMTPPQGGSGGSGDADKAAEALAKQIGQQQAAAVKTSGDILGQYMI